jgi:ribosomal protein S20
MKTAVGKMKTAAGKDSLTEAFSAVDKAVKRNLIHKNKAARLKSQLSKLVAA